MPSGAQSAASEGKAQGDGGADEDAATGLTGALAGNLSPDLKAVVDAWPSLPDAIRAGIVAMIRAAKGEKE